MKPVATALCVASTLVLAGCGGGSSDKSGICVSPRPSDAAIAKALKATVSEDIRSKTNIELGAVFDCDSNGTREVWYNRSYTNDDRVFPGKTSLHHADSGKWYLVDGRLIEVAKD